MPDHDISTIAALEACLGAPGLPVKAKLIDHVDDGAAVWIAASPLLFAGFAGTGQRPVVTAGGGPAGFVTSVAAERMTLPPAYLDDPSGIAAGDGAGLLFLVPGVGETLRVNGRVISAGSAGIEIAVEECFVHCAKALIRSDFWAAQQDANAPDDATAFLNASRFLALVTADARGSTDVSPKGDPSGLLMRAEAGGVQIAERPGNRLAYGYRNMIDNPHVAGLALVPGTRKLVRFTGTAHITTDDAARAPFVVHDKVPVLATVIRDVSASLQESPALARAGLWPCPVTQPTIDSAAILLGHVKLNRARGAKPEGTLGGTTRDEIASGLATSYRERLY